jgi:hypothetical protein
MMKVTQTRPPRWMSRGGWAAIVGGVVVAMVFVVGTGGASALPSATTTHGKTVRFVAPYGGSTAGITYVTPTGCGDSAKVPVLPSVNLTSGVFLGSGSVDAWACGTSNSSTELTLNPAIYSTTFTVTQGGVYNLTATWNVSLELHLSANSGNVPGSASAFFLLDPNGYLADSSNNSVAYSTNGFAYYVQITKGTYSHAFAHLHVSSWVHMTMKKGHLYNWGFFLTPAANVSVAPGGVSATASFNMGTGGREGTLVSVVLKPVAT